MPSAYGLGIDFGTSNTVALMRWPDGRVRPLLFDANPLLPSAVFAPTKPGPASPAPPDGGPVPRATAPDGSAAVPGVTGGDVAGGILGDLVVGGDALHHARFDPAGLEPNPKQHIDERAILLGAREVSVTDLIAAVLRHVFAEARRVAGSDDFAVALAHPAGWGTARRAVLGEAARRAGLGAALLVPEPVAAAHAFTAVLGQQVPTGKALVVYDLGAGTFDASVVVRRPAGFEAVAVDGLTDVGGLDIDATIVRWLGERYSPVDPQLWTRLADAQDPESLRHRRMLWHDARVAKEMLSRAPAVVLQMPPPLNVDAQLTRDEFEAAAKPLIERTVFTTAALIRQAGIAPDDVAGVLLVGGGSRIPLVATMLHRSLGIAPTITEQPEIVVAEGCLLTLSAAPSGSGAGAADGPLWPAAAAAAAPYASVAGAPGPASSAAPPSTPAANPSMSDPVAAANASPAGAGPVSAQPFSAQPVSDSGPAWPVSAAPVSGQPAPGSVSSPPAGFAGVSVPGSVSSPPAGFAGSPVPGSVSSPPGGFAGSVPPGGFAGSSVSSPPAGFAGSPAGPGSAAPIAPASGPKATSGGERGRGTVYQTGQFLTVTPPPSVPRYVPPPSVASAPVSPGPASRVIPVYDDNAAGRSYGSVRPHSPAAEPVAAGPGKARRGRGNWLNALLVVIALVAVAGAGTTVYLVQHDKPKTTSQTPPDAATGAGANPTGAGAGQVGGDTTTNTNTNTTTTTTAATHAPPTTAARTETITMPELTGLYVDYAKEKLRDSGFTGTIKTQQRPADDPDQVGHVLAQDPKAQKQVVKNGTVTLVVGSEPKASPSASPSCPPSTCPRPTST
ncbi:Hsp70 family protein [Dactylosporangium sp. NPDC000555]|uniref:Hsp70 family protein n=1 Tax=Dactylosporangium sp. NPDC000555 TaxID=3154260 RepID=UPI00331A2F1E